MHTIVVQTQVTRLQGEFRSYLLIAALAAATIAAAARAQTLLYVDGSADQTPHDGTDWCHAFLEVHEALAAAEPNTVIRVADGVYRPDPSGLEDPRDATFLLASSVTLEGGYAGCGADDPNERDVAAYETVLSGDIGTPDDNADNCYHVVSASGAAATAVLDGLTITAGNADGADERNDGGGLYGIVGIPTLANCTFRENSARFGGGMYSRFGRPTLTDCVFTENTVSHAGAGMYNDNGRLTLVDCVFSGNSAGYGGGGLCDYSDHRTTLTNCSFSANSSASGGGLLSYFTDRMRLANCTFTGNSATGTDARDGGGGMWSAGSPTLDDCTFSGNSAATSGGGIYNCYGANPTLTNCTFSANRAASANYADGGGGMYGGDSPTLTNCTFVGNSGDYGGGIHVDGDPMLINCAFNGNSARYGGGMYADGDPTLTNCTFGGNSATCDGGGTYGAYSDPTLTNCTLVGNSAGEYGGGIGGYDTALTLANCIVWGNVAPNCPQFWIDGPAAVTCSCVQGGWPGEGNIDAAPIFAGDFRLAPGSPCIDAGSNAVVGPDVNDLDGDGDTSEPIPLDLHGLPRFVDDPDTPDADPGDPPTVDMGAYEYQLPSSPLIGDVDGDCDVDLADLVELLGHYGESCP